MILSQAITSPRNDLLLFKKYTTMRSHIISGHHQLMHPFRRYPPAVKRMRQLHSSSNDIYTDSFVQNKMNTSEKRSTLRRLIHSNQKSPLVRIESIVSNPDNVFIKATQLWVEKFVHAHKLCPWVGVMLATDNSTQSSDPSPPQHSCPYSSHAIKHTQACSEKRSFVSDQSTSNGNKTLQFKHEPNPKLKIISLHEDFSRLKKSRQLEYLTEKIAHEAELLVTSIKDHQMKSTGISTGYVGQTNSSALKDSVCMQLIDPNLWKTTLIVVPSVSDDFFEFLELVSFVEDRIEELQYADFVQVASFHPQYVYEGTAPNAVDNWTNRSPYAVIHLLREPDVSTAINQYQGNTDKIWQRNVRTMKRLGSETLRNALQDILKSAAGS